MLIKTLVRSKLFAQNISSLSVSLYSLLSMFSSEVESFAEHANSLANFKIARRKLSTRRAFLFSFF